MGRRGLVATLIIAQALAGAALAASSRPIDLTDIHLLQEVADPAFSPGGTVIAYAVGTANRTDDKPNSDLWTVPWQGGAPRALTETPAISEHQPTYSRDGQWLFFLSDNGQHDDQLWVMPAQGGAARQVSSLPGGVSDYTVSPDGRQLAVIAEVGRSVGHAAGTPPPIVIDRFQFKEDGRDYLDDRRQQLFIVDVATGTATQVTTGDFDHWLPSWSPDGKWIALVSKRSATADRDLNYDVYIVAPQAGAPMRRISTFEGTDVDPYWESRPAWSPDSKKLVWLQSGEDKWIYYAPWQLTVADIETGKVSALARIDRCFYKPRWSADGRFIYALVEQDRDTWLARVDATTGALAYVTGGARFGLDFAVADNGRVTVLDSTNDRPFELSAVESGGLRQLTRHNDWLAGRQLAQVRDISFKSGDHDIHGLLVLPVGYEPGKRYPTILRLHGGPVYQYSHEFMFDWQLYAAHGYAVIGVNPRGSSGRGFDFARAIYGQWGTVDVQDALAAVDHVVAAGVADPDRLGVGGWSYGSILTNYVIASDTRFKAAVSGAGTSNMLANYGHDQYAREYEMELGTPWRNFESYVRNSYPFLHADRIKTPTLFQCAQKDFNVPCLGAEQMFQALRSEGVPTRLVLYPGENHGLVVPSYLEDRLRRNLDWYDRYLRQP